MPDEAAFLRSIMGDSHNNAPRLVFADWLEERGDPWSELIRLQNQLPDDETYKHADSYGRGRIHRYSDSTNQIISRCDELLTPHCSEWMLRLAVGSGVEQAVRRPWEPTPGDMLWWRQSDDKPAVTRLFWWRGFPERAEMAYGQWASWHDDFMNALPLWHLKITDRVRGEEEGEIAVRAITKWAGRLTTVDLPYLAPANAFTAWMCNMLDACGEKCHGATGRPFTLKIGQASMSGPPHSASERWQRYCDRWLKDSNVQIISRLEARPVGELLNAGMPSGVR